MIVFESLEAFVLGMVVIVAVMTLIGVIVTDK